MKTELTLGQCDSRNSALHKIYSWKPASAKSFTIKKIRRYNYSVVTYKRNYFSVEVEYHSNKRGTYQLGNFSWRENCMLGKRFA
jgi:hypothetical protein